MKQIFVLFSVFIHCQCLAQFHKLERPTPIPFNEGIERGLLSYTLTGAYNRESDEIAYMDGIHYGKCMLLTITNKTDSTIYVKIENGRLLIPEDSSVQNMLVTQEVVFSVQPEQKNIIRLYAMCAELHDDIPCSDVNFLYGGMADSSLIKIAAVIEKTFSQNIIGQHAVWAVANNADSGEVSRYGANANTLKLTKILLIEAGVITALNPVIEVIPVAENKSVEVTKDAIEISKTVFFMSIGSVIAFIIMFFYFIFRKTNQNNTQA